MQQVSRKSPAHVRSGKKLRSSNHDCCDRESGNEISSTNDAHFWIKHEERTKSDPVVLNRQSFGPFVFSVRHDPSVSSCAFLRIPVPGKQPSIGERQVARQAASAEQDTGFVKNEKQLNNNSYDNKAYTRSGTRTLTLGPKKRYERGVNARSQTE